MTTQQLNREVFETSRLSEYFTEKEFRSQIGYHKQYWPIVILRELIDNALDACEEAGVQPQIEVNIEGITMSVCDNGTGIPAMVVERTMDYLYRVSNKAYYIAPTRGQMGNALKVVYAAPYVMTGHGNVEIIAQGVKHQIMVKHDRITGQPDITYKVNDLNNSIAAGCGFVKNGTFVKTTWQDLASLINEPGVDWNTHSSAYMPPTPMELLESYAAFNPHATFVLNGTSHEPTITDWEKWKPNMPTSAHWYNIETLRDLVAGNLAIERNNGRQKTIREFISEFRGLAGTAKQKKVAGSYARETLSMFEQGGDINTEKLGELLAAMQNESKPPKPKQLGVIGKEHLSRWMLARGASEQTIRYNKRMGTDDDGMPYIMEACFAVNKDDEASSIIRTGLNWSPVVGQIPDETIRTAVHNARIDHHDPVIFLIHIARPRIEFMDRGKTRMQL